MTTHKFDGAGRVRSTVAALAIVAMLVAGCGSEGPEGAGPSDEQLSVVVTTTPLGDLVSAVAGDDAEVTVLLPIGADPHDFSPSASQLASIVEADLVVANGLGLESGLEDTLDAAAADGTPVLEIAPLLDPLPFGTFGGDEPGSETEEGHEEEHDDHDHDEDPHVWMDPLRMADAAHIVAGELTALDPGVDWESAAATYADELIATDATMRQVLSTVAPGDRKLVTGHDALGYLADRYDFEVVGVVVPGGSTLGEPSSADVADLVDAIDAQGVAAIFTETTGNPALAEAVALESGGAVDVIELYTGSLGGPGSGAETLIDMLLLDAGRIADGLGG